MKKITLTFILLMIFCSFIYAENKLPHEIISDVNSNHIGLKSQNNFSMSAIQCGCLTTFSYGGYSFQFEVSYASTSGCDPCFASETYGGIFYGSSLIQEGEVSSFGLGFACGVNMQFCPI